MLESIYETLRTLEIVIGVGALCALLWFMAYRIQDLSYRLRRLEKRGPLRARFDDGKWTDVCVLPEDSLGMWFEVTPELLNYISGFRMVTMPDFGRDDDPEVDSALEEFHYSRRDPAKVSYDTAVEGLRSVREDGRGFFNH